MITPSVEISPRTEPKTLSALSNCAGGAFANFARLCTRVGVANASLHTWRHTFATQLVRSTGDIKAAQEILGHQDIRHTMIYAHTTPEHLQARVRELPSPTLRFPQRFPQGGVRRKHRLPKYLKTQGFLGSGRGRNRTCDFHRVKMAL